MIYYREGQKRVGAGRGWLGNPVRSTFLENLSSPFGVALVGDDLYVANTDAIVRYPYIQGETSYPVEIGLVGDVKETLAALNPLLMPKTDRSSLSTVQKRMRDWNALLDRVENTQRTPLRPQTVIRALSDALADDALISLDCGCNTHFAARHLRLRAKQGFTGTGMMASMGPGLSFAIAGSLCEFEVALLVAEGASNKQVARQLGLCEGTVKLHVRSIFRKVGVSSRYRLIKLGASPNADEQSAA